MFGEEFSESKMSSSANRGEQIKKQIAKGRNNSEQRVCKLRFVAANGNPAGEFGWAIGNRLRRGHVANEVGGQEKCVWQEGAQEERRVEEQAEGKAEANAGEQANGRTWKDASDQLEVWWNVESMRCKKRKRFTKVFKMYELNLKCKNKPKMFAKGARRVHEERIGSGLLSIGRADELERRLRCGDMRGLRAQWKERN